MQSLALHTIAQCTVSRGVSWPMWNVRRTILVDSWLWSLVDKCIHDECVHAFISKITGLYGLYAAIHKNLHWIFDNLTLMGSKASKAWGGLVIVYLIFWLFGGGFVIFWPGLDYQKTRVNGPTHCPQCTALLVIVVGDIIQCAASIQRCSLLLYYYAFCWQMFYFFRGLPRRRYVYYDWLITLEDLLWLAAASLCSCAVDKFKAQIHPLSFSFMFETNSCVAG